MKRKDVEYRQSLLPAIMAATYATGRYTSTFIKAMKKKYKDFSPKISLPVLGTLCFVSTFHGIALGAWTFSQIFKITLLMSQIRFEITKELSHEIAPPVMRSKDCWFLYTVGNSDRVRCVLRAFMVVSSPVVSLVSTVLLLFGKAESNPYYFIPWLFLTLKGLLLVQTDNLITIFKDMTMNSNHTLGSRIEDMKWLLFYFTFFLIDLVEAFSFCEIFDLFLLLWNRQPEYNEDSTNLEAVKKEIADIMESLSKCSSIKSSKLSSGNVTESEEGRDILIKDKSENILSQSDGKAFDERELLWSNEMKNEFGENFLQKQLDLRIKMNTHSEGDAHVKVNQGIKKVRNFSSTILSVDAKSVTEVTGSKPEDVGSPKLYCNNINNGSVTAE